MDELHPLAILLRQRHTADVTAWDAASELDRLRSINAELVAALKLAEGDLTASDPEREFAVSINRTLVIIRAVLARAAAEGR